MTGLRCVPSKPSKQLWSLQSSWRAPKALELGISERQHLLRVGREDSELGLKTTGGRQGSDTSAARAPLFAAPSCTVI